MISGRSVRIETAATLVRYIFGTGSKPTLADAILHRIGEDIALKPIRVIASLLEEGGRQCFVIGLVIGVLDVDMVVYLWDDMGSA